MIKVTQIGHSDPLAFDVTIRDGTGESHHRVTISRRHYEGLAGRNGSAEDFIAAAFRFLLDREPKEAILGRFDVSVISRYFPEFEAKLPEYMAKGSRPPPRGSA